MRYRSSSKSSRNKYVGGNLSKDKEDKNKSKLPKSVLGKIVSLFFVSLIIYILVLCAKYF
jgi:hypothetical protein